MFKTSLSTLNSSYQTVSKDVFLKNIFCLVKLFNLFKLEERLNTFSFIIDKDYISLSKRIIQRNDAILESRKVRTEKRTAVEKGLSQNLISDFDLLILEKNKALKNANLNLVCDINTFNLDLIKKIKILDIPTKFHEIYFLDKDSCSFIHSRV